MKPEENRNQTKKVNTEDEIDLIALVKSLWDGRKTIVRYTIIGAVIGLIIALVTPKEFTITTTIVPQTGDNKMSSLGGLSSLAAMAGFNLDNLNTNEALSPLMYPRIVQSLPFQLELLETKFNCPGIDEPVSLFQYYTEYKKGSALGTLAKYTIGLPGVIIKAIKNDPKKPEGRTTGNLITLSPEQEEVRMKLDQQINLELNDKEGYLSLQVTFEDAVLAAQVAQKTQSLLQEYISKYKIEKATDQLHFVSDRYNEKKAEFEGIQKQLALFRDRNKNVSTAMARTQEEQLLSQYNVAYSVYSELAKQLEQAQIKVKEDTPILTIIDPVHIPNRKTKPNRPLILIIWIFLGAIVGTGMVFGKTFLTTIKENWNK
jgi:uncharacterized protein involved in exopolysaccharide biosynthesis